MNNADQMGEEKGPCGTGLSSATGASGPGERLFVPITCPFVVADRLTCDDLVLDEGALHPYSQGIWPSEPGGLACVEEWFRVALCRTFRIE